MFSLGSSRCRTANQVRKPAATANRGEVMLAEKYTQRCGEINQPHTSYSSTSGGKSSISPSRATLSIWVLECFSPQTEIRKKDQAVRLCKTADTKLKDDAELNSTARRANDQANQAFFQLSAPIASVQRSAGVESPTNSINRTRQCQALLLPLKYSHMSTTMCFTLSAARASTQTPPPFPFRPPFHCRSLDTITFASG